MRHTWHEACKAAPARSEFLLGHRLQFPGESRSDQGADPELSGTRMRLPRRNQRVVCPLIGHPSHEAGRLLDCITRP